jgi:hypothetical protein
VDVDTLLAMAAAEVRLCTPCAGSTYPMTLDGRSSCSTSH